MLSNIPVAATRRIIYKALILSLSPLSVLAGIVFLGSMSIRETNYAFLLFSVRDMSTIVIQHKFPQNANLIFQSQPSEPVLPGLFYFLIQQVTKKERLK